MNAEDQGLSALMIKNLTMLHVGASVQIDQKDVPILRSLTTTLANANALISSDAQVDRGLIQIPVSVNALNQNLGALMLKYSMTLHANVSAQFNQQGVPTLRLLIMIAANVVAPGYSNVLVDRDSIQTHVNVSAPDPDLRVPMLRNLTIVHASVYAQIDQQDAPTLRFLMTHFASVFALRFVSVLEVKSSIQTSAFVNVPTPDLHAAIPSISTVRHANVSVPILNQNVPSLRSSMLIHVSVNAPLLDQHAVHHTSMIPTHVPASVLLIHVLLLSTLIVRHAVVNVAIDTPVPRTMSSIEQTVNASVPGWRNVGRHRDSILIHASVNVQTITPAQLIKFLTAMNADASVIEILDVADITPLTMIAVIVCVIESVLRHTSWTQKSVIACVTKFAPGDINSTQTVSVFL